MLIELTVENIAIIDQASLVFGRGFTALTGETGAGKSLLSDAISLVLGDRGDSTLVRSGASKASVTLLASVEGSPALLTKCAELGVEVEDGQLVVQRDLSSEGRSTARLNGKPVSISVLKSIGALLVDLHGQHDHQALLVPERQIDFLDAWIGDEASALVSQASEEFALVEGLRRRLSHLNASRRDREQRVDMLQFQVQEIDSANLKVGESEQLQVQIERLRHAERLISGLHSALNHLVEDDSSASNSLGLAVRELDALVQYDTTLSETLNALEGSMVSLKEGILTLRESLNGLDLDPSSLEQAAGRLDTIKRMFRKYGDSEEAVLDHLEACRQELEDLTGDGTDEEEISARLVQYEAQLTLTARSLTDVRTSKAKEFEGLVKHHLQDLAMEKAEFKVEILAKPVDPTGADDVTFAFTANLGEPLKPLSKVASGGEISRVMLAIKIAGAGRAGVPTMIFDEVDTGLGGRAAAVTARKLEELAYHNQVLVITHLPQIAARADHHFRIEKSTQGGRTVTSVVSLEGETRVHEIARMLAGETVGQTAIANAREMAEGKVTLV